ncbi:hypothetical protein [Bacteroides caecimuris]|nr:hypothetical protein [Bacteroides caecimuris]
MPIEQKFHTDGTTVSRRWNYSFLLMKQLFPAHETFFCMGA